MALALPSPEFKPFSIGKLMTSYSGTDNLEVMAEAKNYNAFLLALILQPIKLADVLMDFGAGIAPLRSCSRNGGMK